MGVGLTSSVWNGGAVDADGDLVPGGAGMSPMLLLTWTNGSVEWM